MTEQEYNQWELEQQEQDYLQELKQKEFEAFSESINKKNGFNR